MQRREPVDRHPPMTSRVNMETHYRRKRRTFFALTRRVAGRRYAKDPSIAVGICSAATKAGFEKVVNSVVGPERLSKMDVIMAGDDVTRKKPDPLIYNLAREKVGLPSNQCVVVEDSLVGLRAALGANMPCIITPCPSSDVPDFMAEGAKAVMDCRVGLGDGDTTVVTLAKLFPQGATEPNFSF